MRELASHFAELKSELVESGMEASQAELEAEKRLGEPSDVAARLNATHNSASWKSALLCAVPFVCGSVSYLLMTLGVTPGLAWILYGVMLAAVTVVGIRELVLGRRPAWLVAWLAGSLCVFFRPGDPGRRASGLWDLRGPRRDGCHSYDTASCRGMARQALANLRCCRRDIVRSIPVPHVV